MGVDHCERIVIVGGGFAGLAVATRLAQAGLPVIVLEADKLGADASTRNQGWLYSGAWFAKEQPDLAKMCFESYKRTVEFCPECLEPGFEGMAFLFSKVDSPVHEWVRAWDDLGVTHEKVNADWVRGHMSQMDCSNVHHAYLLPDRVFRPEILVEALGASARNAGAEIRTETSVTELLYKDDAVVGVKTGRGEEIAARHVIQATGAMGGRLESQHLAQHEQGMYTLVPLSTHLISISPDLGRLPFCVVDRCGFNHVPHSQTSVFGAVRWQHVKDSHTHSIDDHELAYLWENVEKFFPDFDRSQAEVHEWSGAIMQAMHVDQIEPGLAPRPTVINHHQDSGGYRNLWTVSPGRATLWSQLADMACESILTETELKPIKAATPPWHVKSS